MHTHTHRWTRTHPGTGTHCLICYSSLFPKFSLPLLSLPACLSISSQSLTSVSVSLLSPHLSLPIFLLSLFLFSSLPDIFFHHIQIIYSWVARTKNVSKPQTLQNLSKTCRIMLRVHVYYLAFPSEGGGVHRSSAQFSIKCETSGGF